MSSWPLIADFARMVQNPRVGFRSPELKQCTIEMNQLGQPKARSGNFATVYRGFRPDGTDFAIRVFNRRQDERLEHYRTISEYLENRTVSSIVKFEYDDRGIRSASDGKLYPLLIMDWVPGITLFEWVRDRSREGYAEALRIAADVWLHLVRELAEQQIVHGDLSHGNVMVSPQGYFKLVDYDCMCVPALLGRRNLETGLPPYQHPGRSADTILFPGLDNFSAIVIYVALRALAAAPQLWITYVDQPEYDKILFRVQDFENPAGSPLYRDLMQSPDEQVRDLAYYLFQLYRYRLQDVPPLDEVLLWCESVESLVSKQEWDKVVQLVQRMGPEEQIAPEMQPLVEEAQQRVACRKAVEEALAKGDEAQVERLYATGLLHNYPAAAHLVEPASQAAQVRPILRILQSAKELQAWQKLRETWHANQHLLAGRASARPYELEIQKLDLVDRIGRLLDSADTDEQTLLDAWKQLEQLGGHRLAEPYRQRIRERVAQRQSLQRLEELLRKAPKSPTLSFDKKIVAAAPAELIERMDRALPAVQQYLAARNRLAYVKRVHELEKQGTVQSETFIASVMQHLPNGYHEGLARRSQQARKRLYLYRELEKAAEEPCSEAEIVAVWDQLGKIRGRVLVAGPLRERVELAVARAPLIRKLQAIPETADPAEQERQVVALWDDSLLRGCHDAAPWQWIYERACAAQQTVAQIEQAVEAEDLAEAERLLAEPSMEGRELPSELAARLEQLRSQAQKARAAKRQAIIHSLLNNDRPGFVEQFDRSLIAEICQQFRHHQPVVSQWVETEILPPERIGLAAEPEAAVTREADGHLRIVWTWPPANIADQCYLVITKTRPPAHALPEDVPAQYSVRLHAGQFDSEAGHRIPLDAEWEESDVYVWAVIDLGFQVFYSQPFHLGRVPPEHGKHRRWGFFRSRKAPKADEPAAEEAEPQPADAPPDAEPSEPHGGD